MNPFDKVWLYRNSSYSDKTTFNSQTSLHNLDDYIAYNTPGFAYVHNVTEAASSTANDTYFGSDASEWTVFGSLEQFTSLYWTLGTNGTDGTMDWQYWNGSSWASLTLTESSNPNFTAGGYAKFSTPGDWVKRRIADPLNSQMDNGEFYYVRAAVNTPYTVAPKGTKFYKDILLKDAGDIAYFGENGTFESVSYSLSYEGSGGTVVWEYWNGGTWTTLTTTASSNPNFENAGYIDFSPPGDWAVTSVNGEGSAYYYVRARVSVAFTQYPSDALASPNRQMNNIIVSNNPVSDTIHVVWTQNIASPATIKSDTISVTTAATPASAEFINNNQITYTGGADSGLENLGNENYIKTSDGTLHLFTTTSNLSVKCGSIYTVGLLYYQSTDGSTWTCQGEITNHPSALVPSVAKDSSDNIYLVYAKAGLGTSSATLDADLWFRKLTYSGGTWTIGSQRVIAAGATSTLGYALPSIVVEDTDRIWVTATIEDTSRNYNRTVLYYSSDLTDNPTWTESYTGIYFDKVWSYYSSVYSNETTDAGNTTTADVQMAKNTGDIIYFGRTAQFNHVSWSLSTNGTSTGRVAWEYYDGDSWELLALNSANPYSTENTHFNTSTSVMFPVPSDWATTSINGEGDSYYYVRARVTNSYTTAPVGTIMMNAFSSPANNLDVTDDSAQLVRYGTDKVAVIFSDDNYQYYMRTRTDTDPAGQWSDPPTRITPHADGGNLYGTDFKALGTSSGNILMVYKQYYYNPEIRFTYYNGATWSLPVTLFYNTPLDRNFEEYGQLIDLATDDTNVWVFSYDTSQLTSKEYTNRDWLGTTGQGILSYKKGVPPFTSSDFDANATPVISYNGFFDNVWTFDSSATTYSNKTSEAMSKGEPSQIWRYTNSTYTDYDQYSIDMEPYFSRAWTYASGAFTDATYNVAQAGSPSASTLMTSTGDILYLGNDKQIDSVGWTLSTPGAGGTVEWEYWNGASWSSLSLISSNNINLTGNGDIIFTVPGDWVTTTLGSDNSAKYYIRARATGNYSTPPVESYLGPNVPLADNGDIIYLGGETSFSFLMWYIERRGVIADDSFIWEYWNGTTWSSLESYYIWHDFTHDFSSWSDFLFFNKPADWATTSVNGEGGSYYYVRGRATADYSEIPFGTLDFELAGDLPIPGDIDDITYYGKSTKFETVNMDQIDGPSTYYTSNGARGGSVVWEYYNGSAWAPLTKFTEVAGANYYGREYWQYVSFKPPGDWSTTAVNGEGTSYYYVRSRVTQEYSDPPILSQVLAAQPTTWAVVESTVESEAYNIAWVDGMANTGIADNNTNYVAIRGNFIGGGGEPSNTTPNSPSTLTQYKSDGTTDETTVVLKMTVSDTDNPEVLTPQFEVREVGTAFSNTSTNTGSNVNYSGTPLTASVTVNGLVNDSSYHWQARVCDDESACSAWVAYGGNLESAADFIIDTGAVGTGPTGTIVINNGDGYTDSVGVTLSLTVEDDTTADADIDMLLSNVSDFAGASWEDFSATRLWTLSSGDGIKTVYVKYRDTDTNESSSYNDTIILDANRAPTGRLVINSDNGKASGDSAEYTNDRSVKLYISVDQDGGTKVQQMKISNDKNFRDADWESYAEEKDWRLTNNDGLKTVYIKIRDEAGNESNRFSESITLDTTPPELQITRIETAQSSGGTYYSTSTNLSFYGIAEADSKVKMVLNGSADTSETDVLGDKKWQFTDTTLNNGNNGVLFEAKDNANNRTILSVHVVVDSSGESFPDEVNEQIGLQVPIGSPIKEPKLTNITTREVVEDTDLCYKPMTYEGKVFDFFTFEKKVKLPKVNGTFYAIEPDGEGGWFIGGKFNKVGKEIVSNVVHILPNGQVDKNWAAFIDGEVYTIELDKQNEMVYLGGNFTYVNDIQKKNIAAVSTETGILTKFNPKVNSVVLSLEKHVSEPTLYAATCTGPEVIDPATTEPYFDSELRAPTINTVDYIYEPQTGTSVALISWVNPESAPVSYVDVSTDPDFKTYYNKHVPGTDNTVGPVGFDNTSKTSTQAELTIYPDSIYYARLYNGEHSPSTSFSIKSKKNAVDTYPPEPPKPAQGQKPDEDLNAPWFILPEGIDMSEPDDTLVTILWVNPHKKVTYVDISTEPEFDDYFNKKVTPFPETMASEGFRLEESTTLTESIGGMFDTQDKEPPGQVKKQTQLKLRPYTRYYVRLYNGKHSPVTSFVLPEITAEPDTTVPDVIINKTLDESTVQPPTTTDPIQTVTETTLPDTSQETPTYSYVEEPNFITVDTETSDVSEGPPVGGTVLGIASDSNTSHIYIAGSFNEVINERREQLAAIDTYNTQTTDWDPSANDSVTNIVYEPSGNKIYAAGLFDMIGGKNRNGVAQIDPRTGEVTNWNPYCYWWLILSIAAFVITSMYYGLIANQDERPFMWWFVPLLTGIAALLGDQYAHNFYIPTRYDHFMWLFVLIALAIPSISYILYTKRDEKKRVNKIFGGPTAPQDTAQNTPQNPASVPYFPSPPQPMQPSIQPGIS
ncbi:MAG: hypothetical protein UU72_C0004G0022 [candidate division WWE3 bacterium GW2011_GWB1_41_6]|uniref:Uncharacterized protein n=1 Tax=candidate division WWE3 bacterium GW2011_GWB1_41_6 TaxID=1619112 RepID=A0A0G0ZW31_UNCKA|nr:MAG: hypothetical protein UU72_C0004G0022 [candidate division WWE3 bacterium GW2011_GWB1_41_6]